MNNHPPSMIVLGPNPAWQKVLFFDHFQPGGINRAQLRLAFPSGKGVNFCRAARCHGGATTRLLQFAGGETGRRIIAELQTENIAHHTVPVAVSTRVCTTCVCRKSGAITEIIEPSEAAPPDAVNQMLEHLRHHIATCDLVALCGTLPSGTDPVLYEQAARLTADAGKPLLADCWEPLDRILTAGGSVFLKINQDELAALTGEHDLKQALRRLSQRRSPQLIAITAGAADAWLLENHTLYRYRLPHLAEVVNSIGSGDTASAVFGAELLADKPPRKAFALALGAAMANCRSPRCGDFEPEVARLFTDNIEITEEFF